jgi:microcystin-dependent protein
MPAGTIMGYAGTTAPLGFLFCDATAVSRVGYPQLFSAIGTTFGVGDGTTTFNLPDLRGRSIVGLGTNAAVNALALSDGVTTVANRRPQHRHTPHQHTPASGGSFFTNGSAPAANVTAGGGQYQLDPNTNLKDGGSGIATDSLDAPAYLVTNYIISTTTVAPVVASNVTAYGGSVASASSIAITGNSTYLLTGTTGVSTATGATAGNTLTLVASGQSVGSSVTLNYGVIANALSLRDGANLAIFAGESVTFVYNGTYWLETARSLVASPAPWTAQLSNLASFANLNWNTRTSFVGGTLTYVNSTGAQNAYMEWKVPLSAGTWTFAMNYYNGSDRGIYTLTIDGGGSLGTIDGYFASSNGAYSTIAGIAVTSNTNALVRLTMATKNASSSSYSAYFINATMQRTA